MADVSETTIDLGDIEEWHRMVMEVTWTDSGKMIIRHSIKGGGRINHVFEISADQARQMTDGKKNA